MTKDKEIRGVFSRYGLGDIPQKEDFWTQDQFSQTAAATMASFQLLEEVLRATIGISYSFIKIRLRDQPVGYEFKRSDLKKSSLGQLVYIFRRLTNNKEIVKDLDGLLPLRNNVAHQAFIRGFDPKADHQENIIEMIKLGKRVNSVMAELVQGMDEIRQAIEALSAKS